MLLINIKCVYKICIPIILFHMCTYWLQCTDSVLYNLRGYFIRFHNIKSSIEKKIKIHFLQE